MLRPLLLSALLIASIKICVGGTLALALAEADNRLRVEIHDKKTGQPTPARVYLVDGQGKHWTPKGLIQYVKGEEEHFISPGDLHIQLPASDYTLTVERGPEYHPWTGSIRVQAGQETTVRVLLDRWVSMNQLGWYSGDLHNHRPHQEMARLLLAEDLNLTPTLTDWVWEDGHISRPPESSDAIRIVDAAHVYSVRDKEVERLMEGPGAVDLVGLKQLVPFRGYRLYPPNDTYCKLARAQGAYVDAEKIFWRDVAALVALRHIDFVGIVHNHFNRHGVYLETDRWGMIPKERPEFNTIAGMPLWAMEIYYRFLNCGFRLPVSAGSASGVMPSPLGYNRVYVKLDEPFSYNHWFRALKAGRSFATNGPMLFLTVDGQEPGNMLRVPGRRPTKLRIRAEALSVGTLDRLEIISKGRVIHSVSQPDTAGKLASDFEADINETGWIAARCFERPGKTIRFAHTSPVYIQFGSHLGIVPAEAKFFIDWLDREIEFYKKEPGFKEPSHRREMLSLFQRARTVYSKLYGSK